jgi:hypothetical protein
MSDLFPLGNELQRGFDRDVGELRARIGALESELQLVRRDVREIRDALLTVRGGWKALAMIVAISASLGAAIAKLAPIAFWPRP